MEIRVKSLQAYLLRFFRFSIKLLKLIYTFFQVVTSNTVTDDFTIFTNQVAQNI